MVLVPETFVDGVGEISLKHGMIRIELVSLSGPEPRATQRLVTSLQAFSQMLQALNGMREQLEKSGVIRPSQPAPEPVTTPERSGSVATVRRLARIEPVPQSATAQTQAETPAPQSSAELRQPKSPNFSDA